MQQLGLCSRNSGTGHAQNLNSQHYLSFLVTPEDAQPNNPETNQQSTLTSNILPATITENKLLDTIFSFKLEEPSTMLLFSGAALKEKPINIMYTDAKVDSHSIKLILDSRSAGSIITRQFMDQLGHQLICIDCSKKLSSMDAYCGDDEEYQMTTKFYCHPCLIDHFGRPKQVRK
ncbi:hypothetical protein G9A89_020403 [Geosiphon pyriformis]|nr:hypothetical protein G9A89_020403 [Geosiphon pyriformis]